MDKKIQNYFIISILLLICFEMLTNANIVIIAVQNAYNIWAYSVFPSLFPFFVISSILIGLNFHKHVLKSFKWFQILLFFVCMQAILLTLNQVRGVTSRV